MSGTVPSRAMPPEPDPEVPTRCDLCGLETTALRPWPAIPTYRDGREVMEDGWRCRDMSACWERRELARDERRRGL